MDAETARLHALARIAWDRILRGEDGIAVLLDYGRDVRGLDPLPRVPSGTWDDDATPVRDVWDEQTPQRPTRPSQMPTVPPPTGRTQRGLPAPPPIPETAKRREE